MVSRREASVSKRLRSQNEVHGIRKDCSVVLRRLEILAMPSRVAVAEALSKLASQKSIVRLERLNLILDDKVAKKTKQPAENLAKANNVSSNESERCVAGDMGQLFGGRVNCSVTVKFQMQSPVAGARCTEAVVSVPFYCAPVAFQQKGSAAQFEQQVSRLLQDTRHAFVSAVQATACT